MTYEDGLPTEPHLRGPVTARRRRPYADAVVHHDGPGDQDWQVLLDDGGHGGSCEYLLLAALERCGRPEIDPTRDHAWQDGPPLDLDDPLGLNLLATQGGGAALGLGGPRTTAANPTVAATPMLGSAVPMTPTVTVTRRDAAAMRSAAAIQMAAAPAMPPTAAMRQTAPTATAGIPRSGATVIPADYDPMAGLLDRAVGMPSARSTADALLRGLGLCGSELDRSPEQLASLAGQMLAALSAGLMTQLAAQRPVGHFDGGGNPLLCHIDPQLALRQLLHAAAGQDALPRIAQAFSALRQDRAPASLIL